MATWFTSELLSPHGCTEYTATHGAIPSEGNPGTSWATRTP